MSPPAVPSTSPTMAIQDVCSHRSAKEPRRYPATVPAGSMNAIWLYRPTCTHGLFFRSGSFGSGIPVIVSPVVADSCPRAPSLSRVL